MNVSPVVPWLNMVWSRFSIDTQLEWCTVDLYGEVVGLQKVQPRTPMAMPSVMYRIRPMVPYGPLPALTELSVTPSSTWFPKGCNMAPASQPGLVDGTGWKGPTVWVPIGRVWPPLSQGARGYRGYLWVATRMGTWRSCGHPCKQGPWRSRGHPCIRGTRGPRMYGCHGGPVASRVYGTTRNMGVIFFHWVCVALALIQCVCSSFLSPCPKHGYHGRITRPTEGRPTKAAVLNLSTLPAGSGSSPAVYYPLALPSGWALWTARRMVFRAMGGAGATAGWEISERSRRERTSLQVLSSKSLPPLIVTEQPDFSTLVQQAVSAAMKGLFQQMAMLVVIRRRMKNPGAFAQHHRATAEPWGHPSSTVRVIHLQMKISLAPEITMQGAVGVKRGSVYTAAMTAIAAMIATVGAVRPVMGAEHSMQALSAVTTINRAVDGDVNALNWALNTLNGAMNEAVNAVHRAMKGAVNNGNRATTTVKGAVTARNGAVPVTRNPWNLHPHTVNTVGTATGVICRVTPAIHQVTGITATLRIIHLSATFPAVISLQSTAPHRSPTVAILLATSWLPPYKRETGTELHLAAVPSFPTASDSQDSEPDSMAAFVRSYTQAGLSKEAAAIAGRQGDLQPDVLRHGSQIQLQLSVAGPTNRPQPKVIKQLW